MEAVERQVRRFPDLAADEPAAADLSAADRALAGAIYHTTIQRWLTLEHLLGRLARGRWTGIEPRLRAILMSGGAQVLFLDGVPNYAAVDQSVSLARRHLRAGAAKMANAVLRRLTQAVDQPRAVEPWQPDASVIPLDAEHVLRLNQPMLPDPADRLNHLAAALSHPTRLLATWLKQFDIRRTKRIALHGLQTPPCIVHVGDDPAPGPMAGSANTAPAAATDPAEVSEPEALFDRHAVDPRFVVWRGTHEQLRGFLHADPAQRWVQDPAAALSIDRLHRATAERPPGTILDYCAGSGTKTRQLALAFPETRIVATDPDAERFAALTAVAEVYPNVLAVPFDAVDNSAGPVAEPVDAVLLDVPCSNTGVLARRGEARYRYSRKTLTNLIDLQRRIVNQAAPRLRDDGWLAYSTCSVDRAENQQQARHAADRLRRPIREEVGQLPGGQTDRHWSDGAYVALLGPRVE